MLAQVKRAIDLRNIVTSLGPAYIKLGQALSIRPDLLSPAAMVELQKLCDKVPSFDNRTAMAVIREELGGPWQEFYAELTPDPIAAASLGQVGFQFMPIRQGTSMIQDIIQNVELPVFPTSRCLTPLQLLPGPGGFLVLSAGFM